ncbi:LysM domain-containing protein [Cellulomonas sp. PhB143]|uniref:LysM peptidoglycan-binding domain-containing protein n=1 Tax=Cellulomonas sp. PhB143 TaxID=2485186 RepID=UPI000F49E244|nr:LysM domain-containing protein [Cellulomonas sp. PhB143]ROS78510.1 hypothetical protein EDF32_0407 [Cellulomonas sp. PhB143]
MTEFDHSSDPQGSYHPSDPGRRQPGGGRFLAVAGLAAGSAGVGALFVLRGVAVLSGPAPRVQDLVELAVLAAGTLTAVWLLGSCLVAASCLAASAAGRRWVAGERLVARHGPALVRRAARLSLTVGVGAGLSLTAPAAFASAGPAPVPRADDAASPPGVSVVELGWLPTSSTGSSDHGPPGGGGARRPPASAPGVPAGPAATPPAAAEAPRATDDVVVRPGDTLWSIAADALPVDATPSDVAAATRGWYARNVDVVGDDPDLILPGQHLSPPA